VEKTRRDDQVGVTDTERADQLLNEYGYKQEFGRTIRRFAAFAIGFSFISITTGIFTTYGTILNSAGPLGVWTWPIVIVGQFFVALVFGALAARMPLAGYSYQWMSRLANPKIGWLLGWFAFAFLVVDVVAVDYAVASTVLPALFNATWSTSQIWIACGIVILLQGLLIARSTIWTARVNSIAVGTEVVGILGLVVLLVLVGAIAGSLHPDHVFSTGTVSSSGWFGLGGLTSDAPFVLAFLLGAFTIVGFEAAANLAEETHDSENAVPTAMWQSVVLSGVIGFLFLLALNLASGNLATLTKSSTPVADIVTNTLGGVIGRIFLLFVTFSIFACGLVIFLTVVRLVWAMSRDNRFPGDRLFRQVHTGFRTPVMATILCFVLIEVVLGIFANQTSTLFNLFSAATLMPAIIYLATVLLYVGARRRLPPSLGFTLGSWETPVIVLSLVWLVWELSIFRDASFKLPWIYLLVMVAIGLVYFAYLLIARPATLQTVGSASQREIEVPRR
jgi:amino acid transporter